MKFGPDRGGLHGLLNDRIADVVPPHDARTGIAGQGVTGKDPEPSQLTARARVLAVERLGQVRPGDRGYVQFVINYFDEDVVQDAHVLAFLHLLVLIQEDLAGMFGRLFSKRIALPNGLSAFEQNFAKKVQALVAKYPEAGSVLRDLGGWRPAA
jgi:hypothetical protein